MSLNLESTGHSEIDDVIYALNSASKYFHNSSLWHDNVMYIHDEHGIEREVNIQSHIEAQFKTLATKLKKSEKILKKQGYL
jgi:hypothetical protein